MGVKITAPLAAAQFRGEQEIEVTAIADSPWDLVRVNLWCCADNSITRAEFKKDRLQDGIKFRLGGLKPGTWDVSVEIQSGPSADPTILGDSVRVHILENEPRITVGPSTTAESQPASRAPLKLPETGAQLKGLRDSLGWTQAQLADRLGLSQARISKLEGSPNVRLPMHLNAGLRELTTGESNERRGPRCGDCRTPQSGRELAELLEHLAAKHGFSRGRAAKRFRVGTSTLRQYEYLSRLPEKFKARVGEILLEL
jgi:hypothetical protein